MNTRQRQSGMSIPGILVIMIMVGFFVMNAIRMAPPYFEYLSVKDIIRRIATDFEADKASVRDIRRKIENVFNTNQIYELDPKDVEIYRNKGKMCIDANYEVRLPVMGPIDAVLVFDDLVYVLGSPDPVVGPICNKK